MLHAAPAPGFKRRLMAPKAAVALLSAFFFLVLLHAGFGGGFGSSLTTTMLGVGDHTVLRHSILVRDGSRAAVSADHGDRTSAPPPRKSSALVVPAIALGVSPSDDLFPHAPADGLNVGHESAAHRPRAPPSAA